MNLNRSVFGPQLGRPPGYPYHNLPPEAVKQLNKYKSDKARECGKPLSIADLFISSFFIVLGLVNGILGAGWLYAGAQLGLYTGSVLPNILVLTLSKKKRAALFWFIWTIIRFGELVIFAVYFLRNLESISCRGCSSRTEDKNYKLVVTFVLWLVVSVFYLIYGCVLLCYIWPYYKAIKKAEAPNPNPTRPNPEPEPEVPQAIRSEVPFFSVYTKPPGSPFDLPGYRLANLPLSQWDIAQAEKARQEQNNKDTVNSSNEVSK